MARSKLEAQLDDALRELYPLEKIAEDMPIKVAPGKTLYVDRVIRGARIAIEADGRQHTEFVKMMHGDATGFKSHKERDRVKELWLRSNGYTLVRVRYDDTITAKLIRERILKALNEDMQ